MGKLSVDLLVVNTADLIRMKQEEARDSIVGLILAAKISEPQLYEYYREMISRDDCKDLVPCLSEKFSNNMTTVRILTIRKELCASVQKILDEFRESIQEDCSQSSRELAINTSPLFAPLFCRLKQLEQFLFRLS
ncbi:hypothetical protein PPL_08065 [Heterostelium album PN500]|uniref:Uncharacterized protein n=1 Tax=Heterostelium pallidum (strain ATCC 26659 / Pp 5 / PN500) TaxID=670386 RepID=D3BII6_HETP5|nr:hypothetical protein PPL_08065 [Heterostelium album PN500]EFA78610.1 hypothetical protein PPL_08065 [Heterostelium album PN500]|eukprot:XP_020430734.1 hypothetical protein PPL_08065 [Heterostelium album PN500]